MWPVGTLRVAERAFVVAAVRDAGRGALVIHRSTYNKDYPW